MMFPNCLLLLVVVVTYTIIIILIITKSHVISNKYRQVIVHLVHRDKNDKEITNMETSAIFVTSKTIITADKRQFQDRMEINYSPSHLTNNPDKIIEETSNSCALQHTDTTIHPSISLFYSTPSVHNLLGDLQLTRSIKDDTNSQFTIIALSILIIIGVICLLVNFFYNGCSKD